MLALGFPVPTVLAVFAAKRLRGCFVHSNVNVRFGILERIFVTPFFHHWHHGNEPGTWNTNYAVSFPAVDWLFGTLQLPDHWPRDYGSDGTVPVARYLNRLLHPWSTPRPSIAIEFADPDRGRLTPSPAGGLGGAFPRPGRGRRSVPGRDGDVDGGGGDGAGTCAVDGGRTAI